MAKKIGDVTTTTNYILPLSPLKRRMLGRPTVKGRRDTSKRIERHNVSKIRKRILCSVCKQVARVRKRTDREDGNKVMHMEEGWKEINMKEGREDINRNMG